MARVTPSPPLVGGRYRIDARVGSGGMATVYRAVDGELDRPVAVKLLHPHLAEDDHARQRFRTEARHAARLSHPNLVTVFDHGIDGRPFIVMEWVDGGSLRDRLQREGPLTPEATAEVVTALCAGLATVHEAGLVHRDVKPENVLLARAGPKVADFGIARALADPTLTPTGEIIGSPHYLAPEIVHGGDPTPASDQYAVGVLVFEVLTGRVPLPADNLEAIVLRHAREPVPPPSSVRAGVSPALDAVVTRATATDPADRHPSVDALSAALRAAVDAPSGGETLLRAAPFSTTTAAPDATRDSVPGDDTVGAVTGRPAPPAAPPIRTRRRPRRRRLLRWALLALAVLVVLGWLSDDVADEAAGGAGTTTVAGDGRDEDVAAVGHQVADGSLAFTVTDFDCVGRRLGDARADGRFCRLDLDVTNVEDDPHAMIAGMQRLIDADDREFKPHDAATIGANWGGDMEIWWGDLNPGRTVSGTIVFDVPTGATPVAVRLHDGFLSGGTVVGLR